jgi:hypothetical protein
MNAEKMLTEEESEDFWRLLHKFWTRDTGTDGYDKKEWQKFEEYIIRFIEASGHRTVKSGFPKWPPKDFPNP